MKKEEKKMPGEKWKDLKLEGLKSGEVYEVSNLGRIRHREKKGAEFKMVRTVNTRRDGSGYMYFTWAKSAESPRKIVSKPIHRLVAFAFNKKEDHQNYVLHLDYDKTNNQTENLKWGTRLDVSDHYAANPNFKRKDMRGVIRNSKLTENDVRRLKKRLDTAQEPLYKIAKEFGITHTQLNRIRNGVNWAHIKAE